MFFWCSFKTTFGLQNALTNLFLWIIFYLKNFLFSFSDRQVEVQLMFRLEFRLPVIAGRRPTLQLLQTIWLRRLLLRLQQTTFPIRHLPQTTFPILRLLQTIRSREEEVTMTNTGSTPLHLRYLTSQHHKQIWKDGSQPSIEVVTNRST